MLGVNLGERGECTRFQCVGGVKILGFLEIGWGEVERERFCGVEEDIDEARVRDNRVGAGSFEERGMFRTFCVKKAVIF